MAEKIVSPGVFTKEKDLSFLPQGIGEIGAVIIGTTAKGPAFVPTVIESFADFEQKFGSTNPNYYVPYAVQSYLRSAGTVTIVRCLGLDGYSVDQSAIIYNNDTSEVLAVLAPSAYNSFASTTDFSVSSVVPAAPPATSSFELVLSGSAVSEAKYSCSFDTTKDDHIEKVFGTDPQSKLKPAYCYKLFNDAGYKPYQEVGSDESTGSLALTKAAGTKIDFSSTEYSQAYTPMILSQNSDSLFQIKSINHGSNMNQEIKISIYNIKAAGTIAGSEYGSFSIAVRKYTDTDKSQEVLESFQNMNFDPNSSNFVLKVIGDRYLKSIDADGKIKWGGNYANKSKYIYVSPASYDTIESFPKDLVPYGHSKYSNSVSASGALTLPAPSFKSNQQIDSVFNLKGHYGVNLDDLKVNSLNSQFFGPIPKGAGTHANGAFSLNTTYGTADAPSGYATASDLLTLANSHVNQRKFTVGLQWGFDGFNPARSMNMGEDISTGNSSGFSFSGATSEGQVAWKKALNSISNPDEFDVNLIITPGIVQGVHDSIITHTINICEDRGDCFYLMDCTILGKTISDATNSVSTLDTNYAATYWPWVKIIDTTLSKPVWVPPSVVLGGVIAYTDKVSHEWFAPAGLNRGGLTEVVEAETRLTHAERDDLYEDRVNPIASFPGQGVVVWGQKTLQGKPSALDRVNVRRLLIKVKKFIASASRYLVFEQNTASTRQRFLNIANPFLESVQANSGLSAFKVVMDESNNTPDLIDRNILYGQIFVQPTRTAEFIVLDFSILPTGAAFPE